MVKRKIEWKKRLSRRHFLKGKPCMIGQVRGSMRTGGAHSFRKLFFSLIAHSVRRTDIIILSFLLLFFSEEGYFPGINKL